MAAGPAAHGGGSPPRAPRPAPPAGLWHRHSSGLPLLQDTALRLPGTLGPMSSPRGRVGSVSHPGVLLPRLGRLSRGVLACLCPAAASEGRAEHGPPDGPNPEPPSPCSETRSYHSFVRRLLLLPHTYTCIFISESHLQNEKTFFSGGFLQNSDEAYTWKLA